MKGLTDIGIIDKPRCPRCGGKMTDEYAYALELDYFGPGMALYCHHFVCCEDKRHNDINRFHVLSIFSASWVRIYQRDRKGLSPRPSVEKVPVL